MAAQRTRQEQMPLPKLRRPDPLIFPGGGIDKFYPPAKALQFLVWGQTPWLVSTASFWSVISPEILN